MRGLETVSAEELRRLIRYDPATGQATWLERPAGFSGWSDATVRKWNARFAGKRCGGRGEYISTSIRKKTYPLHRVVWAIHNGQWPEGEIDHINGDPFDNRIANLRVVSCAENNRNRSRPRNNSSGVLGVYRSLRHKRCPWKVSITVDGKSKYLGMFACFGKAIAACKAADAQFGYHQNHGRSR